MPRARVYRPARARASAWYAGLGSNAASNNSGASVAKEPDNPGVTIRDAQRQKRRTPGDGKADPQDIVIIAGVGCQLLRRRPGRVLDAHVHLRDLNLEAQSGQAPHIRRHVRWPRAVIETHMHLQPDTADGDAARQHAPR